MGALVDATAVDRLRRAVDRAEAEGAAILVDGVIGKRTRQAIEAYQRAEGIEVTGEPTSDLAEHIRYTREIAEASLFTGSVVSDPDDPADVQRLDSIAHVAELQKVGQAVAKRVRPEHFAGFPVSPGSEA